MSRVFVLYLVGVVSACVPASAQEVGSTRLKNLPEGWAVTKSVPAFSRVIAGRAGRITNTVLAADRQTLQVNVIACNSDEDAVAVHDALVRIHGGVQARCPREGKLVFELVGELKMVERAYRELGFKPQRVTYDVSFQATPVASCDPMAWNKLFNAFLVAEPNEARVRELSKSFTFGDQIRLRNHGLGTEPSAYTFTPAAASKPEADGEVTEYTFGTMPRKFDVPQVGVKAVVTSEAFARTPSKRGTAAELLAATEFWPSTDEEVVALARAITAQSKNPSDKVAALLAWFANPENFRFDKTTVGSRKGVKTALQQRFGQCWDYSDCFVTLCRAAGVPCRQVLGWLYGLSGHVWAEVLADDAGWRQVDPQAGAGCDSRYVPFVASERGAMPLVYTSAVRVVPREAADRPR